MNERSEKGYTRVDLDTMKEEDKRRSIETILAVSKIFQYGKTTVPKEVRKRLLIDDGDKLVWSVDKIGSITVSRGHSENHRNGGSLGY